jgi:uncharacterized protein
VVGLKGVWHLNKPSIYQIEGFCDFNSKFTFVMKKVKYNTKQDLLEAISENKERIKSFGVNGLGIFGSFSKGTSTDSSDVDLLVDFIPEKKNFDNFMDLSFFLEALFGRKVELVTRQSLSKHIGPHILNEVFNVSL